MKLRYFVSTSAFVLVAWLGFTFINEVPIQRYPKHDKYTAARPLPAVPELSASGKPLEIFQVSLSH